MSELAIPSVEPDAWAVVTEVGPVATIYRAELGKPFTSEQFYRLLEHIAPSPEGDSHGGVIADWRLPDNAANNRRILEEDRLTTNKRLIVDYLVALEDMHKPLKQAWDGFMPSRKLFMHLVDDARVDTSFKDSKGSYINHISDVLIRPGEVDVDLLIRDHLDSNRPVYSILEMLGQAAGHTTPKAQKDFATEHLSSFVHGLRGKNKHISTPKSLAKYLEGQKPSRVRMLTQQTVYHAMKDDPEMTTRFRKLLTDLYCAPITVDGRPYLYRKAAIVGNIEKTIVASEEINNGSARARIARVRVRNEHEWELQSYGDYRLKPFILPGTVEPLHTRQLSTVTPVVRWLKGADGTRQFLLDEPMAPDVKTQGAYKSSLFGALVLAYMCPEVRERWPKQVGLPGSENRQAMGIAQVPVLTLFEGTKRKLLSSAVINGWERATGYV